MHSRGHGVVATRDLPKVETVGSNPIARSKSELLRASQCRSGNEAILVGSLPADLLLPYVLQGRGRVRTCRLASLEGA